MKLSVLALGAACASLPSLTLAQAAPQKIDVDEAIRLAASRNGTLRAAFLDARASHEKAVQAFASYLPTITPEYRYVSERQSARVLGSTVFAQTETGTTTATLNWKLLDFGIRDFTYKSAKFNASAAEATAFQTLRKTLFSVYSGYIEALRTQETLKVNDAQVERTAKILEQTVVRVRTGDVAGKERLQAKADALNAVTTQLSQKQQSISAMASLKALIGWESGTAAPTLADIASPAIVSPGTLAELVAYAHERRPDLLASRLSLKALDESRKKVARMAGPTFSLDAGWTQTLTPHSLQDRAVTFTLSTPLYDGGLTRAEAKEAALNYASALATYEQQVRAADADIESALFLVTQNQEVLKSATLALEAATLNYQAAVESQRLGASNLIDVLTARVSLATAENNAINAKYDTLVSIKQLALVTGKPLFDEVQTKDQP